VLVRSYVLVILFKYFHVSARRDFRFAASSLSGQRTEAYRYGKYFVHAPRDGGIRALTWSAELEISSRV
jgi:hypothetical protein